jgi:hypothetical protein
LHPLGRMGGAMSDRKSIQREPVHPLLWIAAFAFVGYTVLAVIFLI